MYIHSAAFADKGVAPRGFQQLAAAQRNAAVRQQHGQQCKLPRGQAQILPGAADPAGCQIDGKVFIKNILLVRIHE